VEKESFWTTTNKTIAAITALIVAVTGLIGALAAAGVFEGGGEVSAGNPTAVASSPVSNPTSPSAPPTATAPPSSGDCEVTIANPLATLREQPDTFSQEITKIPASTYRVLASQNVTFGPQTQRWFQINVDGRVGWLMDNTFNIERKTAACP
jgi:hypothetical protein